LLELRGLLIELAELLLGRSIRKFFLRLRQRRLHLLRFDFRRGKLRAGLGGASRLGGRQFGLGALVGAAPADIPHRQRGEQHDMKRHRNPQGDAPPTTDLERRPRIKFAHYVRHRRRHRPRRANDSEKNLDILTRPPNLTPRAFFQPRIARRRRSEETGECKNNSLIFLNCAFSFDQTARSFGVRWGTRFQPRDRR
jgi:hypothetical protein